MAYDESLRSDPVNVEIPIPPSMSDTKPVLTAVLTANQRNVQLNWTAVPDATMYVVEKGDLTGNDGSYTLETQNLAFLDNGLGDLGPLTQGATYEYVVWAYHE